jgi:hypothetical protein
MIPLVISIAIALLALGLLHKSRKMLAEASTIYDRAIAMNNETIAMRAAMINERKPASYAPYVGGKFVP